MPSPNPQSMASSNFAPKTLTPTQLWRQIPPAAAAAVLLLLLAFHLISSFRRRRRRDSRRQNPLSDPVTTTAANPNPIRKSIVSDGDLRELMNELDGKSQEGEVGWEGVVDKRNGDIYYNAKCCRPKDGPLKYLSVTIFEKCSTELLRDFYMDNEYRKEWDKTLVDHKRLQVDETNGTEIGCMIKKFPLLTPREYILAWRVWEGKDKTFFCLSRDCEHPLAPLQKKYVRVGFFRSGWRIRKVPGRDACEITVVHQEDAGLNIEMAKLAFARGIWSYVCKMNNALRQYRPRRRNQSASVATMLRLIQEVPPAFEIDAGASNQVIPNTPSSSSSTTILSRQSAASKTSETESKLWKKPSAKLIANGLLILGGVICLSRRRTTLGTQLAMACILKKLMKHPPDSDSGLAGASSRISRPRHESRQRHLNLD